MSKTKIYVVPKDNSFGERAKAWIKNRKTDFDCWWEENKETVVKLTPVIIGGTVTIAKIIGKISQNRDKKWRMLHTFWDPQAQHWWIFEKGLTPAQFAEYDRRKANGEKVGDILRDMGLIKD